MRAADIPGGKLLQFITGTSAIHPDAPSHKPAVIGILEGNGIGPEIIASTVRVLDTVGEALSLPFELRYGGSIGEKSEAGGHESLPADVIAFCERVFSAGGAILSGPGGGRYVYDLRRRFDLFCKFVPVRPWPELARAGRISATHLENVDVLIVRDNVAGVYQGNWSVTEERTGRVVEHVFRYSETDVYRLVEVAALAARSRRGRLHLIVKDGGVPGISDLWRDVGLVVARKHGVNASLMNVDFAVYELIQHPDQFDVMATPNLIGDILADIAGVLVASRGLTFSGNFSPSGAAVYQTNHGCALDLAGTGKANPAGQILSLAMLLRESFGLSNAAALIERSLADTWKAGWRTADVAEPGCTVVGTEAFTEQLVQHLMRLTGAGLPA